ncbi:MAG: DUF362 domain-containing protein [Bacillota bacterium]|nr:DUF362 domain-containing protein [Bacillota bacterium]
MSMITLLRAENRLRSDSQYSSQLLEKLLLAFGGSEFFFGTEEKLAFLLDLRLPAENERGVNFDIRLAYSLVRLYRRFRSDQIQFFFLPAEGFSAQQTLELSGYASLTALEKVQLVDLSQCSVLKRNSGPRLCGESTSLFAPLIQADVLISLVKYKSDQGRLFGSALCSLESCSPIQPEESFRDRHLVDLYSVIMPDLFIIDGLIGSGGFQPQAEDFLMAAADAVAGDAVLSALSGIPAQQQESLCLAAQYGLGIADPGGIALYGDDLSLLMKK